MFWGVKHFLAMPVAENDLNRKGLTLDLVISPGKIAVTL